MSDRTTHDPGGPPGLDEPVYVDSPTVRLPVIPPLAGGEGGAYSAVPSAIEVPEELAYGRHSALDPVAAPAQLPVEETRPDPDGPSVAVLRARERLRADPSLADEAAGVAPAPAAPDAESPVVESPVRRPQETSVGRASGVMALGTLASRGTGFVRTVVLAYVLGLGLVPDAYNAANTLPNMVYELLLGGILTSVFVPLIVRAQKHDEDGGEAYTQRLMTITIVGLAAATLIAIAIAPLLISLQGFSAADPDQRSLAVTLSRLLLPEIFFYGVAAAAAAILNTRGRFGAPMWAPVLNNVVVIGTCAAFLATPGPHGTLLNPSTMSSAQVLVLGVGTTLGIVAQAAALLPALRGVGYRWRLRFDWGNARLGETGSLAGWMLAYVVVSQVGVIVVQHLAVSVAGAHRGVPGLSTFVYAQLLFMLPHGIVAVSIINALMPRMSGAAVDGRVRDVARDLSFGTRMAAVVLLPVTAAFVVLGPLIGTVLYAHGASNDSGGRGIGIALSNGALGLVVFAISQLQIFAFYALRDTRTPALVNIVVVGAKVAVDVVLYHVLPPEHVVAGLMWGNTISYTVCVLVSAALLRRKIGRLDVYRVLRTLTRLTVAAVIGGAFAACFGLALPHRIGAGFSASLVALASAAVVGLIGFISAAVLLNISEVRDVGGLLRARLGR